VGLPPPIFYANAKMLNRKIVFILGAGASCPYGYPSGSHLREYICLPLNARSEKERTKVFGEAIGSESSFDDFRKKFEKSSTKSIDLFMARNPKLAQFGKCIIAYEIFTAEHRSLFREKAEWVKNRLGISGYGNTQEQYLKSKDFQGGIWYEYLFDRLTAGLANKDDLPDFSNGNLTFITFNYDRSLEYFLHESLRNSFSEVPESKIVKCLQQLKIIHIYGQIAPLKWQNETNGVDYKPQITATLLKNASLNLRTIYEEQENPELTEAKRLISQAEQIFFLGFGYAPENLDVLGLPGIIPLGNCPVFGTAYGLNSVQVNQIKGVIIQGLQRDSANSKNEKRIVIEDMDCLELLRNYLN
jgi:hypothetical protein